MASFVAYEVSQFLKKNHQINRKRGKNHKSTSIDTEKTFLLTPAAIYDKVSQRMRKFPQSNKR